jgi:hypothetical protein
VALSYACGFYVSVTPGDSLVDDKTSYCEWYYTGALRSRANVPPMVAEAVVCFGGDHRDEVQDRIRMERVRERKNRSFLTRSALG